jgi:hypothetical protein
VKSYEQQEQRASDLLERAESEATSNPAAAQNDEQQASSLVQGAAKAAGQFGMQVCNSGQ